VVLKAKVVECIIGATRTGSAKNVLLVKVCNRIFSTLSEVRHIILNFLGNLNIFGHLVK